MKKYLLCFFLCLLPLHLKAGSLHSGAIGNGSLFCLLKENDLIKKEHKTEKDKEKFGLRPRLDFSLELMFGIFLPGPNPETGNFNPGPVMGAYLDLPRGPGIIKTSLDITSLKTPADMDNEYNLLFIGSCSYLMPVHKKISIGGGLGIVNNSPINDMLLLKGEAYLHINDRTDIILSVSIPPGHENSSIFICLGLGYRL